jgi:hypothetical protein
MITRVIGAALLAIALAGGSMAQNSGPEKAQSSPQAPQGPAITIPLSTGTAINAALIGTLDSSRSKPGDPVAAIVTEPVVYQRSVLLPKGSRITGHVVRTGADAEQTAALFVAFDHAILKNGQEAQLNAGIQALAPVGTEPTIPSREKYEQNRMDGPIRTEPDVVPSDAVGVLPSNYTVPRRSVVPPRDAPDQTIQGGLDRKGMFTPDSKGAFGDPSMRLFTPVSEGSHGTVLVGTKQSVRLENGTRLLIVVQPPASAQESR